MNWKRVRTMSMAGAFLVLAVLACGPEPEGKARTVVINSPGSGSKVALGQEVPIDSTAAADAGIDRVELSVDGVVVSRDMPPDGNPTTFRVVQSWTPTAEGVATISVVAFDANGASSDVATITLQVVDEGGGATAETLAPTETPATTGEGCTADSQFVADVTIPDGTVMGLGQAFVKTWRVRNSGTCAWGAGYELVFVSGAQMGGPASVALPAVAPGDETDISVNLTAPNAYGTHKGTWRMRAADGTPFGVNLSALVVVPAPATDTPEPPTEEPPTEEPPHSEEITLSPSSVGSVVEQIGPGGGCYVGDTALNLGQQCFVTFDVSAIPDSVTIERVELRFSSVTIKDDPFGDLHHLYVYHKNYGDLDVGDWEALGSMNDMIDTLRQESDLDHPRVLNPRGETALQDSLAGDRFQIYFGFEFSDGDGDSKVDIVGPSGIQLRVTYRP